MLIREQLKDNIALISSCVGGYTHGIKWASVPAPSANEYLNLTVYDTKILSSKHFCSVQFDTMCLLAKGTDTVFHRDRKTETTC